MIMSTGICAITHLIQKWRGEKLSRIIYILCRIKPRKKNAFTKIRLKMKLNNSNC